MTLKRILLIIGGLFLILAGGFGVIQLVPYGHNHVNPPVLSEPAWDSPETYALVKLACYDCHSNETEWDLWYARIAPSSWLVQNDVQEGRQHLNFSEWNEGGRPDELGELWESIQERSMPPIQYTIPHPEAKLTQEQIDLLVNGLKTTLLP